MSVSCSTKFNVVIPVKDEADLIRENLPSWCMLKPDEILLCFDFDLVTQSEAIYNACMKAVLEVNRKCDAEIRILLITKNPEYRFHQAWVRREGFRKARNDIILTGDIDLQVFSTCLKAVHMVGKNGIGLVSLMKLWRKKGLLGSLRSVLWEKLYFKRGISTFTGLYCFYRPYWQETEPANVIKNLVDPKKGGFGEDGVLKDFIGTKYMVKFLPDVGSLDTRQSLEDHPIVQYRIGRKLAKDKVGFVRVLKYSLVHLYPFTLLGFIHEKIRKNYFGIEPRDFYRKHGAYIK